MTTLAHITNPCSEIYLGDMADSTFRLWVINTFEKNNQTWYRLIVTDEVYDWIAETLVENEDYVITPSSQSFTFIGFNVIFL